jgi:UDP-GlcNAc:undecaprenyl-phosphate GlcNAc-1-phosphate transferase
MFGLGVLDDWRSIDAKTKLGVQTMAATVMVYGLKAPVLTGDSTFDVLLAIVFVVGITNAINLLDNMDGLAAGVVLIAAMGLMVITVVADPSGASAATARVAAALCGVAAGFVLYNYQPASVFMGDGGSYLLGSLVAGLTLTTMRSVELDAARVALFPVALLLLPLTDTTLVTCIRLRDGRSPFAGGKDHISHRLVALGVNERAAVLSLHLLSAAAASIAVLLVMFGAAVVWPLGLAVLFTFAVMATRLWRVDTTGGMPDNGANGLTPVVHAPPLDA